MAAGSGGADAAGAITRLSKEVAMLEKKPVAGAKFIPGSAANPLEWTMMLDAPDTYTVGGAKRACPYAGHVFTVSIKFPNNYPFKAPDMTFKPGELYHPNVNRETGEICADMISKTWGPTQNVTTLAKLVLGFLETPNMESPLDGDCAAELAASVDKYEASARKYAEKAPKKGSV